jgi:hypothetical protein
MYTRRFLKITTHLHLALPSTCTATPQPVLVGPFTILSKHKARSRVWKCDATAVPCMRNTFNAHDLRPWFAGRHPSVRVYPLILKSPTTDVCGVRLLIADLSLCDRRDAMRTDARLQIIRLSTLSHTDQTRTFCLG